MSGVQRSSAARLALVAGPGAGVAGEAVDSDVGRAGVAAPALRAASDRYRASHGMAHLATASKGRGTRAGGGGARATAVRAAVSRRLGAVAVVLVLLVGGVAAARSQLLRAGAPVALGTPAPGGTAAPSATGSTVVVHVVGEVRAPGVVRLPAGSRVLDAVAAAGGSAPGADLSAINLARPLVDGEQVLVPAPGAAASGAPAGGGSLVDLNTAAVSELDALPGVGPVLAQRIVEHRPFASVDELDEVSGIGAALLEKLRTRVRA